MNLLEHAGFRTIDHIFGTGRAEVSWITDLLASHRLERRAGVRTFQNLIVGAGPAGVAVACTLLDGGSSPTLWMDPAFQSGRLANYTEVPSNTKVSLFVKYAATPASISGRSSAITAPFEGFDESKGCPLGAAQQMVSRITETIGREHSDKVSMQKGHVSSLTLRDGLWQINGGHAVAERVFLAPGAHPKTDSQHGAKALDLDDCLKPSKLSGLVSAEDTIGVIGSSHSAILVLMNLLEMEQGPRVVNLYRSPLKYAKFLSDGTIILDNTGLKGQAADWAKQYIESGHYEGSGRLTRVNVTEEDASAALQDCTKIVSATGFDRNPLPEISVDGKPLQDLGHDRHSGAIIPGKLYGYGIAFPEEITDPEYGHKEANVGLWKFMRYIRKVLPAHSLSTLQQAGQ